MYGAAALGIAGIRFRNAAAGEHAFNPRRTSLDGRWVLRTAPLRLYKERALADDFVVGPQFEPVFAGGWKGDVDELDLRVE